MGLLSRGSRPRGHGGRRARRSTGAAGGLREGLSSWGPAGTAGASALRDVRTMRRSSCMGHRGRGRSLELPGSRGWISLHCPPRPGHSQHCCPPWARPALLLAPGQKQLAQVEGGSSRRKGPWEKRGVLCRNHRPAWAPAPGLAGSSSVCLGVGDLPSLSLFAPHEMVTAAEGGCSAGKST